jgi:hypothetical protein
VLTVAVQDDWTTILTAIGTVTTAIAAVGIAIWSDRKAGNRVAGERGFGLKQLAKEQEFSREQLMKEQDFSRAQIAEERQLRLAAEQVAEAHMVRIEQAARDVATQVDDVFNEPVGPTMKRLAVMVVNGGSYVITDVEAQFLVSGNLQAPKAQHLLPGDSPFPRPGGYTWRSVGSSLMSTTLPPWTAGILIESSDIDPRWLTGAYAMVRWTDRWGSRWEHKRGEIRMISNDDPWRP